MKHYHCSWVHRRRTVVALFFVCLLSSLSLLNGQSFRHTTATANISGSYSTLNNSLTNTAPNKILIVCPVQAASADRRNPSSLGVEYRANRWTIFNQDGLKMPVGAKYNILSVPASSRAFTHTAASSSIPIATRYVTTLDHPFLNNNLDAEFIITQVRSGGSPANPHPVGIRYNTMGQRWQIVNLDSAAMPVNAKFNLVIGAETFRFSVGSPSTASIANGSLPTVGAGSTANDYAFITPRCDNPQVTNTQNVWGVYNTVAGVSGWRIQNLNLSALKVNAAFNVLYFKNEDASKKPFVCARERTEVTIVAGADTELSNGYLYPIAEIRALKRLGATSIQRIQVILPEEPGVLRSAIQGIKSGAVMTTANLIVALPCPDFCGKGDRTGGMVNLSTARSEF